MQYHLRIYASEVDAVQAYSAAPGFSQPNLMLTKFTDAGDTLTRFWPDGGLYERIRLRRQTWDSIVVDDACPDELKDFISTLPTTGA